MANKRDPRRRVEKKLPNGILVKKAFPYYGSKERAAKLIWDVLAPPHLPPIRCYIEPFAGSLSVLMANPNPVKNEIVGDLNGLIVNFFRACRHDPAGVLEHAVRPTSDIEMWAAEFACRGFEQMCPRLAADIDFFDVRMAGLWLYGQCNYLMSNFCSLRGPWMVLDDGEGGKVMGKDPAEKGEGIRSMIPGMKRFSGLRSLSTEGQLDVLTAYQRRLINTRILCSSWEGTLTAGMLREYGNWQVGIFLDPPYDDRLGSGGGASYMGETMFDLSADVRAWCMRKTRDEGLKQRIILCGRFGEHDALLDVAGWTKVPSIAKKGHSDSVTDHKQEFLWVFMPE